MLSAVTHCFRRSVRFALLVLLLALLWPTVLLAGSTSSGASRSSEQLAARDVAITEDRTLHRQVFAVALGENLIEEDSSFCTFDEPCYTFIGAKSRSQLPAAVQDYVSGLTVTLVIRAGEREQVISLASDYTLVAHVADSTYRSS